MHRPHVLSTSLLAASLLWAMAGASSCRCQREPDQPKGREPVTQPPKALAPATQAATQPRLRRPPPPPVAPGTVMTSRDGQVTVTTPRSEGWECLEQLAMAGTPQGGTLVKCRRPRPELFLLVAKHYEVGTSEAVSAEKVVTEERPKHFGRLFVSHAITKHRPVTHQGLRGHEIEFVAQHRGMGEIVGIERAFTKGTHVVLVSAEGRRADFEKYKAAIKPWFDAASFKALAKP